MIRTIVIDDERPARRELISLLSEHDTIEVIGEAANADEAAEQIEKSRPDLIFLDVQMPGKSGFDLLEQIDAAPRVIFVTAYDEYALKAFEVSALDYILKPVEEEKLEAAVNKAVTEIRERNFEEDHGQSRGVLNDSDQVFLKDGHKCWFAELGKIRVFESEGNYVRVFFGDNKPLILKSLNKLEEKLNEKTFFRANRKYIINLRYIDKIEQWFNGGLLVIMNDGKRIEISRRQASKLKDRMSL